MEFALLGPVEVRLEGRLLALGGPKQRALLAMLLLDANEVVSRDRLIDGMWGAQPPPTAHRSLDTYVSRLRSLVGAERIERRAPGYLVCVGHGELDVDRFGAFVERARAASADGDFDGAAAMLRDALGLWRGPALADLLYEPFAGEEAGRLEERRLLALEERMDAELRLGCGAELVAELEPLVREHPFRERLIAQLMLALYQAGRQSQALAVFQAARQRLAEELGLEPGPELRELQRKILEHDPSLGSPRVKAPARHMKRRTSGRRLTLAAAVAAVAVSAAVGITLGTGGTSASSADSTSSQLVALSATSGTAGTRVSFAGLPAALAAGAGSLWVADPAAGSVSRVDARTHAVVDRVPIDDNLGSVAVGGGSVWVAGVPGDNVARIDPGTGKVTQTRPLGSARAGSLVFGAGGLWIADITNNSLIELDPVSGTKRRTLPLDLQPTAIAIDGQTIWVADYDAGSVAQIDLRTHETLTTANVGNGPVGLAVGAGGVWVANSLDSTISRIDPERGAVATTIPVGSSPAAIAVAHGSVWVANQYSATVSRIDPKRNAIVRTTPVSGQPISLVPTGSAIWVGVRPVVEHRGGTLVLLHSHAISVDPALQFDLLPLQSNNLTSDGLVTYNHVPGPAGIHLVPDLAMSLPIATNGGMTYTFRLRPGIRYSDGRPVRAADFRRSIERLFRLGSEGGHPMAGIVGAGACDMFVCDLSRGIVTDETARTVTFHLVEPDPDFLANLTIGGMTAPVPPGTPFSNVGFGPIPGTGPYRIGSASEREIRYVRNPFFREWSHAAQPDGNPDEIVMRFGLSPTQAVQAIEKGRADWSADNVPASLLPSLHTRYPRQLHGFAIPTTDFFQFNTSIPPFDDVRARRAFNFAIDRNAIARIFGGSERATPTCQVLPPGTSGYRRYCPYTLHPDPAGRWTAPGIRQARHLVEASGTRGMKVTVWGWTDDPTLNPRVIRYAAGVLRRIGYRTTIRLIPHAYLAHPPDMSVFDTIQLIPGAWGDTPYGFFSTWFSCNGIDSHHWFCDRRIDRAIVRAQALKARNPKAAAAAFAGIDRKLVDLAAWAPIVDERGIDFVSDRVRNYQSHPYWGIMADQIWLR